MKEIWLEKPTFSGRIPNTSIRGYVFPDRYYEHTWVLCADLTDETLEEEFDGILLRE